MNADTYAAEFETDILAHDMMRPRSQQAEARVIGMSEIGVCRERMRRTLVPLPWSDSPASTAAIIGTYCHSGITEARRTMHPDLIFEAEVTLELAGMTVVGHPDEIDQSEPSVTDYKGVNKLAAVRRTGADEQQRFQRHLYYAGAVKAGLVPAKGTVRNVWFDRSGADSSVYVEQEDFDPAVVHEAAGWLEDALYAVRHGEEASRDKPRSWCRAACPFFSSCRGQEVPEASFPLNPDYVEMVGLWHEAQSKAREGAALKEALRPELAGLTGLTEYHRIISTLVNKQEGGSWRIETEELAHGR